MKAISTLPADFYEQVYNQIMDESANFGPESEEDTTHTCFITIPTTDGGSVSLTVLATFEVTLVDASFDHAFGTEVLYDLEVGDLEDIEVEEFFIDDGDDETDYSETFDYHRFWTQFRVYGTVSMGVQIKHGDEVIARNKGRYSRWMKAIYQYTDKRLRAHICNGGPGTFNQYEVVLPVTPVTLKHIGKTKEYLRYYI
jgi:hypothetical protein